MPRLQRVICHVCGRPTPLRRDGTMFRHCYGGHSGNDHCIGSGERPGMVIRGFVGPYFRPPTDSPG